MTGKTAPAQRNIAIVGPYLSGKTTLLESVLSVTGATSRKGNVKEGTTVGDASAEARARNMTVDVTVATTEFMDDTFTFLDCPGSIEFIQETFNALVGVDAAVVVCEPDLDRAMTLSPILRFLADHGIPSFIFLNKMDKAGEVAADAAVAALQAVSPRPVLLRHLPIREGDTITGYVDLASERAYVYHPNAAAEMVDMPAFVREAEESARTQLLEALADFNDELLERLLEDELPSTGEVFGELTRGLQSGQITPVLIGAAETDQGVRRLLKALRHEVPPPDAAARRIGIDLDKGTPLAQVLKTFINPHSGKLSVVRVWRGEIKDGEVLNGVRVGGVYRLKGQEQTKVAQAKAGDIVALGRLEGIGTGTTLAHGEGPGDEALAPAEALPPVFAFAVRTEDRKDEVKLSSAIQKLIEEDPALSIDHVPESGEVILRGQGEIHLQVNFDRLRNKYNLPLKTNQPKVPYRETIRKSVSQHGRHKKQTGGAGQFGDVHIDIKPLPRGAGFEFHDTIVGGSVPKQYIPAVEGGVREYLASGPLGFMVVDVSVTLTDGSYHAVDSSEIAFKQAARIAMTEGMPQCSPILLEPIHEVAVWVPSEATPKVQRIISGRRGQILGFQPRAGWEGWDEIRAQMPLSELHDLIVEIRSISLGVGTYRAKFDRLQEVSGKDADKAIAQAREAS